MKRVYHTALYTYYLHKISDYDGGLFLDFNKEPSLLGLLFFRKGAVVRVTGDCTVWHYYPNGERVGTGAFGGFGEVMLSEIWRAHQWSKTEGEDLAG